MCLGFYLLILQQTAKDAECSLSDVSDDSFSALCTCLILAVPTMNTPGSVWRRAFGVPQYLVQRKQLKRMDVPCHGFMPSKKLKINKSAEKVEARKLLTKIELEMEALYEGIIDSSPQHV